MNIHYERVEVEASPEFVDSLVALYLREGSLAELTLYYHQYAEQERLYLDQVNRLLFVTIPLAYFRLVPSLPRHLAHCSLLRGVSFHLLDDHLEAELAKQFRESTGLADLALLRKLLYLYNMELSKIIALIKPLLAGAISPSEDQPLYPNKYLALAQLMQSSARCYRICASAFKNSLFSAVVFMQQEFRAFCLAIITYSQSWDFLDPGYKSPEDLEAMARERTHHRECQFQNLQQENVAKILFLCDLERFQYQTIESEEGQHGLLLKSPRQKFLLRVNARKGVVVQSWALVGQSWRESHLVPGAALMELLLSKGRGKAKTNPEDWNLEGGLQQIKASLGWLIAHIGSTDQPLKLAAEFGQQVNRRKQLANIIQKAPPLGDMLLTGGMGYAALMTAEANLVARAQRLTQFSGTSNRGLGMGIGGALIGQVAVPIPVVGAVVGGLMGNLIGRTTSATLGSKLCKGKAKQRVAQLQKLLEAGQCKITQKLAAVLGHSLQALLDMVPQEDYPSTMWSTALWLVLCSSVKVLQDLAGVSAHQQRLEQKWFRKSLSPEDVRVQEQALDEQLLGVGEEMLECCQWLGQQERPLAPLLSLVQSQLPKFV